MTRSRFRFQMIAILTGSLVFVGLRLAAAADPDHVARFRNTHQCVGCDLSKAQLGGTVAPKAKLANANLTDANLYGARLAGADLTGAILTGTDLKMADLSGAVGAVLGGALTDARTTCPDGTTGPCR